MARSIISRANGHERSPRPAPIEQSTWPELPERPPTTMFGTVFLPRRKSTQTGIGGIPYEQSKKPPGSHAGLSRWVPQRRQRNVRVNGLECSSSAVCTDWAALIPSRLQDNHLVRGSPLRSYLPPGVLQEAGRVSGDLSTARLRLNLLPRVRR